MRKGDARTECYACRRKRCDKRKGKYGIRKLRQKRSLCAAPLQRHNGSDRKRGALSCCTSRSSVQGDNGRGSARVLRKYGQYPASAALGQKQRFEFYAARSGECTQTLVRWTSESGNGVATGLTRKLVQIRHQNFQIKFVCWQNALRLA